MIKVVNYFPTNDPKSNVVAVVNFLIPEWGLHLNSCNYVRKRNGGFFIGFPSKKKEGPDGQPQYFPYFAFDKERNDRFQSSAQKAIEEYIKEKHGLI